MTQRKESFKRPRLRTRFGIRVRRLLRSWPFLVWLIVALGAWQLYDRSGRLGGMTGVVSTVAEPVAPLRTARLLSVDVQPGQRVEAGDIVARMDTSLLEAELAVAEARLVEAESTISGYQQNILNLVRQFDAAIKRVEATIVGDRINQARDTAELAELQREQERRRVLLAKGLIGEQDATELRPRIASLEQAVAAYPNLLDTLEAQLEEARKQKAEMNTWLRVESDQDLTAAIRAKMAARNAVFESSKKMFELQRENCNLRATRAGIVSLVMHEPGDVVQAGDPVLRIVAERSNRVIGFLPEVHVTDLTVGQETTVLRGNRPGSGITAIVVSVGPEVMTLPGRISPIQQRALRGRRAILDLAEGHSLIPGETVRIRIEDRGGPGIVERIMMPFRSAR